MDTKELIVNTANHLLIERGFNAFSYKTISEEIGIKTSSIHYHFPTKTDLGKAVIQLHRQALEEMITRTEEKTPLEKINKLFGYYRRLVADRKVCIVGALTSDVNTLEEPLRLELLSFGKRIIDWTASILKEGEKNKTFKKIPKPRQKARLILSNFIGWAQIARIEENSKSFDTMTQIVLDEFIINHRFNGK